jgi:hypothetical protein
MALVLWSCENLRAGQILRQRSPQMRVLEMTEILSFCGIGGSDLRWLDRQLCLTQSPATEKLVI